MKAKFLSSVAALAMLGCFSVETAKANSIDVNYTVSGSAGKWLVDFSVTNNLGGGYGIYYVAFALPSVDIINSPNSNWAYASGTPYTDAFGTYNDPWCVFSCVYNGDPNFAKDQLASGIQSGQTLSGFEALDTTLGKPNSLAWISLAGSAGTGVDMFNEGIASRDKGVSATPLPAALPLFAAGLGVISLVGWRRKRKAAASIADV
jgi:hypothetical protein